jgi:hypothetical protein
VVWPKVMSKLSKASCHRDSVTAISSVFPSWENAVSSILLMLDCVFLLWGKENSPVHRSLTLLVTAVVRCDDETTHATMSTMTSSPGVSGSRCVSEVQLHHSVAALHILQVMFDLFQVKNWLHGANLDLRSESLLATPSVLLCFDVSACATLLRFSRTLDVDNFRLELLLDLDGSARQIGPLCCCPKHSLWV